MLACLKVLLHRGSRTALLQHHAGRRQPDPAYRGRLVLSPSLAAHAAAQGVVLCLRDLWVWRVKAAPRRAPAAHRTPQQAQDGRMRYLAVGRTDASIYILRTWPPSFTRLAARAPRANRTSKPVPRPRARDGVSQARIRVGFVVRRRRGSGSWWHFKVWPCAVARRRCGLVESAAGVTATLRLEHAALAAGLPTFAARTA